MQAAASEPAAPEIALERVSNVFGRASGGQGFQAVDDLTLAIARGDMVAVLGKTGCGKSTMFNMIAGLLEPTGGKVLVQGRDPFAQFNALRGKIAIVFQSDRLLPWRTALGNVELGLEMLGMAPAERRAVAQHWLARLGLTGHEHDYPHALSGGMRQRVSIARAFATDASILLCDEPFSALDEITGARLREDFANLVRENGKTAVFITHSISEALQIGQRIVVLKRPARIAYDVRPGGPGSPDGAQHADAIRARIQEILAQ
jgi:NitT/TauT family transport system ATP-binding protein